MNHPGNEKLIDFLSDSLSEVENAEVDDHLADCKQCRDSIETIIGSTIRIDGSDQLKNDRTEARPLQGDLATELGLQFVLGEEVARGGMGIIYRGFDRELKREVAIKVSQSDQALQTARFFREAQISAQLQHPGIVPVHKLGRLRDGRPYIAMRMVNGQTLKSLIEQKDATSQKKLIEIFGQICNTMAFSHSRQVVHRDLKPENVMVGSFGEVQIMDWGLARKVHDAPEDHDADAKLCGDSIQQANQPFATRHGQILGTPAFMAPEQAKGELATKRSDVFALGGILLQILTGKAPFEESTNTLAIAKSASASLTDVHDSLDRSGSDQSLVDIVKKCLDPDPLKRPADAEVVNRKFNQYTEIREQERQEARLAEARLTERLIAQQKRNRQLIWSASAILGALAISVVAGLMYFGEKNTRIANQNRVEQERIEELLRDEQKIREFLKAAKSHQQLAQSLAPLDQSAEWILARKEIEKTNAVVSDRMDPKLLKSREELSQTIAAAAEHSVQLANDYDIESACARQVALCNEQSFYSPKLRQATFGEHRIAATLANAFRKLDVGPEHDLDVATDRIAQSSLRTELMLGLYTWRRDLNRPDADQTAAANQAQGTLRWLDRLIAASDPDPFRTQIRSTDSSLDAHAMRDLLNSEAATGSVLTLHTIFDERERIAKLSIDFVPYLKRAREIFPDDFFANWYLAMASDPSDVSRHEYFLACNALQPENLAVLWMFGQTCNIQKKYEQAIEALEKVVGKAPRFATGYVHLAVALGKVGQTKKALERFDRAFDMESELATVFLYRGELHVARREFQLAKADLDRYRQLKPDDPIIDKLMYRNFEQAGKLGDAIEALNRVIDKNPLELDNYQKLFDSYEHLAYKLTKSGRPRTSDDTLVAAQENYEDLIKQSPELYAPRRFLSLHLERRGNLAAAIKTLMDSINLVPEGDAAASELTNHLSTICMQLFQRPADLEQIKQTIGRLGEAAGFIEGRNPQFEHLPQLYTALGRLYQKDGQLEKAIEVTEHAYGLQLQTPDDREVISHVRGPKFVGKMLESFGLPSVWTRARGPGKSEQALQRMHNPKAVSSLAMMLIKQGALEKSETAIREALKHTPDSPLLQFALAKSLAAQFVKNGDRQKQAECFEILGNLQFLDSQFQWGN